MTFSSTVSKAQLMIRTIRGHWSEAVRTKNEKLLETVMRMIDCKEVREEKACDMQRRDVVGLKACFEQLPPLPVILFFYDEMKASGCRRSV